MLQLICILDEWTECPESDGQINVIYLKGKKGNSKRATGKLGNEKMWHRKRQHLCNRGKMATEIWATKKWATINKVTNHIMAI